MDTWRIKIIYKLRIISGNFSHQFNLLKVKSSMDAESEELFILRVQQLWVKKLFHDINSESPWTSLISSNLVALRVTSDKDQKMPELEKIDFLRTQPSEAY